jgi:hypothetical protein
MSGVYASHGRARPVEPAIVALAVLAPVAVIVLIVVGVLYYSGSSARISSQYMDVAASADPALTAEVNGYTHNQRRHLAAAKSDLKKEAKNGDLIRHSAGPDHLPGHGRHRSRCAPPGRQEADQADRPAGAVDLTQAAAVLRQRRPGQPPPPSRLTRVGQISHYEAAGSLVTVRA